MPLRSVIVHDSLPRSTSAVISPSKVKLAYEERISRPLSLKLDTVVSFAMRIPCPGGHAFTAWRAPKRTDVIPEFAPILEATVWRFGKVCELAAEHCSSEPSANGARSIKR